MQGTWVRALVWEDPTCCGATKPREPQLLNPRATTTEALMPRARAPQQEKPPQWEARALQQRVAPALSATREKPTQQKRANAAKNK